VGRAEGAEEAEEIIPKIEIIDFLEFP